MKRFISLFVTLVSFLTIGNVGILSAAENPAIESVDFSNAAETVIKAETISEPVKTAISAPKSGVTTLVSAESKLENYIEIAGRKVRLETVSSTSENAGDHANRYGNNFIYGHNSSAVFGGLKNVSEGETFTVSQQGKTTTYRIEKIVLYEKVNSNLLHEVGADGNLAMKFVAQGKTSAKSAAYDLSIMTCAGTSYGNGDASHRLVLFANAI